MLTKSDIDLYMSMCLPLIILSSHVSHSDNNLLELGNEAKDDDRAVLLEGGLSKTASQKSASLSIKSSLIR